MNARNRAAVLLAAFFFSTTLPALADETSAALEQRVKALERQVSELSERLHQLELPASTASPAAAEIPAPPPAAAPAMPSGPPGWQSSANWKRMRAGMNQDQVLDLLGEPEKRSGGKYRQRWEYAGGRAWVEYDSGAEVNEWQAP